jgi:hypothetical protein
MAATDVRMAPALIVKTTAAAFTTEPSFRTFVPFPTSFVLTDPPFGPISLF